MYTAEERAVLAMPGSLGSDSWVLTPEQRRVLESGGTRRFDDAPLAALRSGAAMWWWLGAGAVLVLGAAAMPLMGRRVRTQ